MTSRSDADGPLVSMPPFFLACLSVFLCGVVQRRLAPPATSLLSVVVVDLSALT